MINRDFSNHDVKENVKAGWDFPNHELCHVLIRKTIAPQLKQLPEAVSRVHSENNCTTVKTIAPRLKQLHHI